MKLIDDEEIKEIAEDWAYLVLAPESRQRERICMDIHALSNTFFHFGKRVQERQMKNEKEDLINGDGVALTPYKWVYDHDYETEKFFSKDGNKQITIDFHKKSPMLPDDYKRWFKNGGLSKEEFEKCLKRSIWKPNK